MFVKRNTSSRLFGWPMLTAAGFIGVMLLSGISVTLGTVFASAEVWGQSGLGRLLAPAMTAGGVILLVVGVLGSAEGDPRHVYRGHNDRIEAERQARLQRRRERQTQEKGRRRHAK